MKRYDLQGVRGLSILLVLLFHHFPDEFSNGFVGVDIFFVISGYLMAMLYGQKTGTLKSFLNFYLKRAIRLMPVYALIISSTLAIRKWYLPIEDYRSSKPQAFYALVMATNLRSLFEKKGYWDKLEDVSYFLHTWSFAVEIQYYLIAPFLFWVQLKYSKFGFAFVNVLAVFSYSFNLFGDFTLAFNLMVTRIWQFQLGALSWRYMKGQPETQGYKKVNLANVDDPSWMSDFLGYVYMTILLLFFTPLFTPLGKLNVRSFGTLTSTLLFTLNFRSVLVTNRVLCYLGDISYVLYLVHWPVIVFLRVSEDSHILPIELSLKAALFSTFVSIIIHHILEKPLGQNLPFSCVLIVLCYILSMTLIFEKKKIPQFYNPVTGPYFWSNETYVNSNWTQAELRKNAKRVNTYWYQIHYGIMATPPGCQNPDFPLRCSLQNANGTHKIAVLGNSFGQRLFPAIYETFKDRYSELHLLTNYTYEPLDLTSYKYVQNATEDIEKVINMKANYVFIVNRWAFAFARPILGNVSDESVVREAVNILKKISNSTQHIVLSGVLPRLPEQIIPKLLRRITYNKPLDGIGEYPYQVGSDIGDFNTILVSYTWINIQPR
ncbi:hypothetical protein L596_019730 [Steinernema carpocapsae]|uniref:Acyltransferase 3 domain-containing protein n=1 Tax=Steinernema carpocapsae TaxID=34508 RepID=A0A4V6A0P3_STECR|nr:hypothetical protein L596_019730 [Steinernema carpocapsae]